MYSQYHELFMAAVKRILHRDLEGTNMYVVLGGSFGYKNLCSIGIVTPICCKSAQMVGYKLQKSQV
jgi:hypothetical protein